VIAIELERDFDPNHVHIGLINNAANYNAVVGNAIEVVLKTELAVNDLYAALWNAEIIT
jgi:hypothetical protein